MTTAPEHATHTFIGLPLLGGFNTSPTRAISQIQATAYRIGGDALINILGKCPELLRQLQQFSEMMAMEIMHIAACNTLHEVEERLARWLLMCADRVASESVPLTQEFLAQMLGTRRSSVTVASSSSEKRGVITNTRGGIRIRNRR
jgi:CRP-like cAMP-binding protein